MWQYTSDVIINNNKGNLLPVGAEAPVRFALLDAEGKMAEAAGSGAAGEYKFIVDGVTAFDACDVKAIYHTAYAEPEMAEASLTIELPEGDDALVEGDVLRIVVNLSEQGRSSSILQNAYLRKQRPFVYEVAFEDGDDAEAIAAKFAKLIKKEMLETDFRFFAVMAEGAELVFKGLDCYVRFAKANGLIPTVGEAVIDLFKVLPVEFGGTGYESKKRLASGEVVAVGNEGAGTVAQLIKNMRIPTSASTDPFHGDHGGMPVPGGKYDQWLIEVETKRRHIAGGVVGSINESLTSFVFFVESGLCAAGSGEAGEWTAVMEALASAANLKEGIEICETADDLAEAESGAAEKVLETKAPHGVGNIG